MILLKYFGTDGIRGIAGKSPMTPNFMIKLGQIITEVFRSNKKKIIIGRDTRISGSMLQYSLEFGILSRGFSTLLVNCIPTPAIAYLVRFFNASGGIVISGSHNIFYDNGVKIFSEDGVKLSNKKELFIEKQLKNFTYNCSYKENFGFSQIIKDASEKYINFCKNIFPNDINLSKFTIIIDCANGSTYKIAPKIFQDLGGKVIIISNYPNGININKNSGSTNINQLKKLVILKKADIGLAFDGDGDRVIMVDHLGNEINGDQIIYVIAKYYLKNNQLYGGVVGTLMTNMNIVLALKKLGIPFYASKIGDRYIYQTLKKKKWLLGAEQSGHIILLDKHSTGDGIIASLQVLLIMIRNNKSLHCLSNQVKLLPQVLLNVIFDQNKDFEKDTKFQYIINQSKKFLGLNSRLFIRKSGTESYVRIMVEGENYNRIKKVARSIADVIKSI